MVWSLVNEFFDLNIGGCYESVARIWISYKKHVVINAVTSTVLWSIWKLRNKLCFQGAVWMGMNGVLLRIVKMIKGWMPLYKEGYRVQLEGFVRFLEVKASLLPQLQWRSPMDSSSSELGQLAAQPSSGVRTDLGDYGVESSVHYGVQSEMSPRTLGVERELRPLNSNLYSVEG